MHAPPAVTLLVASTCAAAPAAQLATPVNHEVITRSGHPAPGIPDARFFRSDTRSLFVPFFGPAHGLAFIARVEGPTVSDTNDTGIWATTPRPELPLRLVARTGQSVPDSPDAVFIDFRPESDTLSTLPLNAAGQVCFVAKIAFEEGTVTADNDRGLWIASPIAGQPDALQTIAREGDPAPGASGASLQAIHGDQILNARGDVLFPAIAVYGPPGDDEPAFARGLWLSRTQEGDAESRTLEPIVIEGHPAPGIGATFGAFASVFYSGVQFPMASLSDAGAVAFTIPLVPDEQTSATESSIWISEAGSLTLIARTGDVCPDTNGATFTGFGRPVINEDGDLAFRAALKTSADVTPMNSFVLCAVRDGALELLARDSDPVPPLPNHTFDRRASAFRGFPRINSDGDVAFSTSLKPLVTPGSTSAILTMRHGSPLPLLVARDYGVTAGDPACYFGPFEQWLSAPSLNAFSLNSQGDVAFSNVGAPCRRGIWIHRARTDSLDPVCILDDTRFNVAPPGMPPQLLRATEFIRIQDPGAPALSEHGDITFAVHLEDDSLAVILAHTRRAPANVSPADLDGDEVVTVADFVILAAAYGQAVPEGTPADINADGVVNAADFLILVRELSN